MVWTLSVACILDETPAWLLDGLAKMHAAGWLPAALQSSFFLKGETLQPVTRLLEKIQEHERARLSLLAVSASARSVGLSSRRGGRALALTARSERRARSCSWIFSRRRVTGCSVSPLRLSLIHISEPTRPY